MTGANDVNAPAALTPAAGVVGGSAADFGAGKGGNPLAAPAPTSVTTGSIKKPAPVAAIPPGLAVDPSLAAAANPGDASYRIGAQDVLDISVFKVPELSKSVQVATSGTVNYPLLGDIPAAGRTASELERDLTKKLGANYLQNPQVTVFVKEYNSQRVLVDGAFAKPGVYPVQGQGTLLQFVALSGGLNPTADTTVLVFRTQGGTRTAAKFDVDQIRSGQAKDPTIQAGDVIVASTSLMKEGFDKVLRVIPLVGSFAVLM